LTPRFFIKAASFVIDGDDGMSDFRALRMAARQD
jgi:hypothetical protein